MQTKIFLRLQALFVFTLCVCLLLGALLTFFQFIGVIFNLPDLVITSKAILLKPIIASAAVFGLLSFFASYFQQDDTDKDEDEAEV